MSPADFLPSWLSLDTVITCGAGAANVLALAVLYRAFSPREVVAARGRALARRRKELRDALISTPRPNRRQKPVGIVRTLLERLKLTGGAETRKSADSLSAAGWRSADAMTLFLGCRVGAPPVFGLLDGFSPPSWPPPPGWLSRLSSPSPEWRRACTRRSYSSTMRRTTGVKRSSSSCRTRSICS